MAWMTCGLNWVVSKGVMEQVKDVKTDSKLYRRERT
jgi:hypothetical protein